MEAFVKTLKLRLHLNDLQVSFVMELMEKYKDACNYVSQFTFENGLITSSNELNKLLYSTIRDQFGLKSQITQSVFRTVTARYKTVEEQLKRHPFRYQDEEGNTILIPKTLEWLEKPVFFRRPQADLVRNRDYSFVRGKDMFSINTLKGRVKVTYDKPECFEQYFDGSWSFGTGKLVELNGNWYLHIPLTKDIPEFDESSINHVVGIDRGLRFLVTSYDEKGNTMFESGKDVMKKREIFGQVRAELQAKGTKSAKRVLKRISGRENRWMSDVNHQISKTLTEKYGPGTLFALEDLTDVSFDEQNLSSGSKEQRHEIRSWAFYQLEQFLSYKAREKGSIVIKVPANYTSQRCPKCGRIHKENRNHVKHEYVCDRCGFRTNDDRLGAMNIQLLGTLYASGDHNVRFRKSASKTDE